ncbi:MAG: DnaJ domain-containing protein [Phycisphaerales bacterium]|nr:DnaJ domain-containing protein [Phycisphaerales bacterium]
MSNPHNLERSEIRPRRTQPSSRDDPFALLKLPRRFDLPDDNIERAYLKLAASLHPDRLTDPSEQAQAARLAARVNDARRELRDAESRANVLLRLLGGPTSEQNNTLPDGFLMETMEAREAMEAARDDPAKLAAWRTWVDQARTERLARIGELFAQTGDDALPGQAARDIRIHLNALRYVERMIQQLDPEYDHHAEPRRAARRR